MVDVYSTTEQDTEDEILRLKREIKRLQSLTVPDDCVRVPKTWVPLILDAVREKLQHHYNQAFPVCCQRPGHECCEESEPAWNKEDQKAMDELAPIERHLAMLAASEQEATTNE